LLPKRRRFSLILKASENKEGVESSQEVEELKKGNEGLKVLPWRTRMFNSGEDYVGDGGKTDVWRNGVVFVFVVS
jgi:hypothetical protein